MTFDQQLQLWNAIGTWVAGIATFLAVLVSLHLARKSGKVKLKVVVGHRMLVGGGQDPDEVVLFAVTNQGERPVIVSNIAWVVGKRKNRRYAMQMFGSTVSARIPHTLAPGQKADFMVFFSDRPDWLEDFATTFVESGDAAVLDTLRVEVYTTSDKTTRVRPEAALLSRLARAFDSAAQQQAAA